MKRIWLLVIALIGFISSSLAQNAAAPPEIVYLFCYFKGNGDGLHYAWSKDGYNWNKLFDDSVILKPTVSNDKLMRDPCIIRGRDNRFHMVWTVSWNDRGIGYASSPDLLHWSTQQFIPVMMKEDSARNTWAPEATYDPESRQYIVYWATTISGRFPLTDTAAESKYNHRIYYVTTKDFRKWSATKLLYEPGFSVIDASIVWNGNEYVMFLKNETRAPEEKNIRVAYAKKITGPWSSPSAPITGKYWAEGPTATRVGKEGKEWIVYFDKYHDHKYGAVSSTDLVHWQDISDKVRFPAGVRHGSVIVITQKEFENLLGK